MWKKIKLDVIFFFMAVFLFLKKYFSNYLFIYSWLHCVFVATCGFSLVAASGGCSSLWCAGFSLQWLLVAEHGL